MDDFYLIINKKLTMNELITELNDVLWGLRFIVVNYQSWLKNWSVGIKSLLDFSGNHLTFHTFSIIPLKSCDQSGWQTKSALFSQS